MSNYTQSSVGVQAPTELKRSAGCALIRIGSESAKADPNPARKTRERVLTYLEIAKRLCIKQYTIMFRSAIS